MTQPHPPPPPNRPHPPYGGPYPPQSARGPVRGGDVAATVVSLMVLAVAGLVASVVGLAGVYDVSTTCEPEDCHRALATVGALLATLSPWIALVPAGTWAVVRLVQRRLAWWVVWLALPVGAVLFLAGVVLAVAAER